MALERSKIHDDATVFDIHAHPSLKQSLMGRLLTVDNPAAKSFNPFSVRTDFPKLKEGGVNVLGSAITVPEICLLEDCKPLRLAKLVLPGARRVFKGPRIDVTLGMMDAIERAACSSKDEESGLPLAQVARSVSELDVLLNRGNDAPVAIIHTVEGAHSLDQDVDNLDELYSRGVASITLAHFYENGVAPPVFPFPKYVQKLGCFEIRRDLSLGLSALGIQVVERMLELGILIDLTHCTPTARKQVFDIVGTKAPLLASHVGTSEINRNPYNLEDWEVARIADTGGVVGVIFMNYWLVPNAPKRGIEFISQTIRHFVSLVGEDHVAIGSDFDGFTDPPDDLEDASKLPLLTQRLLSDGLSPEQTRKILGGNAVRVIREGWGKQH